MNDGVGGAVTLTIIIAFIAVVSAYMAFNVNYTKAFRMKNKVVDNYNKFGIECRSPSSECYKEIVNYAAELGYKPRKVLCPKADDSTNFYPSSNEYYCAVGRKKLKDDDAVSDVDHYYFTIVTTIDIDIPIVRNVFGLRLLTISGDTKTLSVKSDKDKEYLKEFDFDEDI